MPDEESIESQWKRMKGESPSDEAIKEQYEALTGKKGKNMQPPVGSDADRLMAQIADSIAMDRRAKNMDADWQQEMEARLARLKSNSPLKAPKTPTLPPLLKRAEAVDKANGNNHFSTLFSMIKNLFIKTGDRESAIARLKQLDMRLREQETTSKQGLTQQTDPKDKSVASKDTPPSPFFK